MERQKTNNINDQILESQFMKSQEKSYYESNKQKQYQKELEEKKYDSIITKLQKKCLQFYFKEYYKLLNTFKRSKMLSIFIILILELQNFSISFYDGIGGENKQGLGTYLAYFRIHPLISSASTLSKSKLIAISQYIFLFIIVLSISSIIMLFILRLFNMKINKQIKNLIVLVGSFINKVVIIIAYLPVLDQYFLIASNYTNYPQLLVLSNVNLILYNIWMFGYILHDFDYSFIIEDHMSKRESYWTFFNILYYFIQAIIINTSLTWQIPLINSAIGLFRMIDYLVEMNYFSKPISSLVSSLRSINFILSLYISIYSYQSFNESNYKLDFLIIVMCPIIMKLGLFVYRTLYDFLTQDKEFPKRFQTFDLKIRNMLSYTFLDYEDYLKKGSGIHFESFFTNHISSCYLEDCYCKMFIKDYSVNELLSSKLRERYMQYYTISQFHTFINKKQSNQSDKRAKFLFFAYLIEIVKIPTKAFTEIVQMKYSNNYSSLKEQYILESIVKKAKVNFKGYFNSNSNQNQRINMMSVIDFDELLFKITKAIRCILVDCREFFNFLSQDYFTLKVLQQKGNKLIQLRDYVDKILKILFNLNPFSRYLYFITEIFLDNFNFKGVKISSYISKSNRISLQSLSKDDLTINLYKPNSCIIYISLLNPIGKINRVTSSVETIFGQKKENLIGQNCGILMPFIIQKFHDKFLSHFIERGISKQNLENQMSIVLCKQQNGFIFPMIKRIKIDQFTEKDFGVCAFFEQINNGYDYMLCNRKGAIQGISQKLFEDTISKFLKSPDKLAQYDIGRLIPITSGLIANHLIQEQVELTTVMILPQNEKYNSYFFKYKNHPQDQIVQFMRNIDKHDNEFLYYEVSIKIMKQDTQLRNLNYYYVEFQRVKKIRRRFERTEMINSLKKELNYIFSKNIKVQEIDQMVHEIEAYTEDSPYLEQAKQNHMQNQNIFKNLQRNVKSNILSLKFSKELMKSKRSSRNERMSSDDQLSIVGTEGGSYAQKDYRDENNDSNIIKQLYSDKSRYLNEYNYSSTVNERETYFKDNTQGSSKRSNETYTFKKNKLLQKNSIKLQKAQNEDGQDMFKKQYNMNPFASTPLPPSDSEILNGNSLYKQQILSSELINFDDQNSKQQTKQQNQQRFFNSNYETNIFSQVDPQSLAQLYQNAQTPQKEKTKQLQGLSSLNTQNNLLNLSSAIYNDPNSNMSSNFFSPYANQFQFSEQRQQPAFFEKKKGLQSGQTSQVYGNLNGDVSKNYGEFIESNASFQNNYNNSNFISLLSKKNAVQDLNEIDYTQINANLNIDFNKNNPHPPQELNEIYQIENIEQRKQDFQQQDSQNEDQIVIRKKATSQIESFPKTASGGYLNSYSLSELNNSDQNSKLAQGKQQVQSNPVLNNINSQQLILVKEDDDEEDENQGSNKVNSILQNSVQTKEKGTDQKGIVSTDNNLQEANEKNFNDINQIFQETNSIHSSMTSSHSRKLIIINAIYSKKPPFVISSINWFGFLAYIFLCATTIVVFAQLIKQFNSVQINFEQMTIPPLLGYYFSQTLADREFVRITADYNFFKYSNTEVAQIRKQFQDYPVIDLNNFKDTYYIAVVGDSSNNFKTTSFAEFISSNTIKQSDVNSSGEVAKPTILKLQIALEQLIYYLFYYGQLNDGNSSIYTIVNCFQFLEQFNLLEEVSYQASINDLQSVKNLLISTLIIIEIAVSIVVFTIFPIYHIVVKSKEKQLKLIGSFSQDKINVLREKIDVSLNTIISKERFKSVQIKVKENSKRRAISSTDTLSSFSWLLVIFSILILVLISLYPCFNIIFTYTYADDFNKNLNELRYIYEAKKQLSAIYSSNFASLTTALYTKSLSSSLAEQLDAINSNSQNTINGLQAAVQSLQFSRNQMGDYNKILLDILQNDACTPILKILDYVSDSSQDKKNFNITQCQQSYNGILQKGLIITMQNILQGLTSLTDLYHSASYQDYAIAVFKFQDIKDFYQFHQVEVSINNLIEIVKLYMINRGLNYFQFLQNLQIYFFIYCQIILFIIFFVGWTFFVYTMKSSLLQAKKLMSLFPLEYILDNPYIMSHINQEFSKLKESK
ncbi:transmembrane protein, putative (macronuclear) [Tetrahymena thermophila SB210]|uniref:Transmembrane protein, putative n=1 Tax=Tetrahymena thermophila (strain SB210) TaxID=312017 RepID=Q248B1_TETTS|nr:transmembrane protein, putative [Tetrahymena thermophila SB210]EAS04134.2 transmembrane protein, putative [Tetrahymena thermophila SB210]|eukprot:XP_001024379.2 transmembrane protein, putative [Tetrahymena thermophila SB210]